MPQPVTIEVCAESGYKATPWCTNILTITTTSDDVHAMYFCHLHNIDPVTYNIDPTQKLNTDFVWIEPDPPADPENP